MVRFFDELYWSISFLNSVFNAGVLANFIMLIDFIVEFAIVVIAAVAAEAYSSRTVTAAARAMFFLEIPGLSTRAGVGLSNDIVIINVVVAGLLVHNLLGSLGFFETAAAVFGGDLLSSFVVCMGASVAYWAVAVAHIARHRLFGFSDLLVHGEMVTSALAVLLLAVEALSLFSRAISTGLRLFANSLAGLIIECLVEELITSVIIEGARAGFAGAAALLVNTAAGAGISVLQVYTIGLLELLSLLVQPCVLGAMTFDTYRTSRNIL